MKTDPTRKVRAEAAKKSRNGSYVYINKIDDVYSLGKQGKNSEFVYKNGSEIAL